jgi:signal transduction histidine kinase
MKTSPEQLIGKTCFEICHGSHEPAKGCPHVQTLEKGIPAEVEVHNAEKGTYTMVSTYPMFGPSGEVVASVHISQDITERRKMQERLMVTNRLASVGELAAGIAHEINNPLTGVLGFSELVLSADIPEAVRADVEVIHAEARRAADVVKNLLIFARRHHQERNAISINEVLNKVLALRAYEQKLNNVAIFADLDPNLPAICADNFQLQQVFLNIIINAEYFMTKAHGRGKLVIKSAYRPEERVIRVAFTDDGPGIAPGALSKLFDPFFTTKEVGQGTGLGLSISHGVIQSHGGRIWAESEAGKGATFIIELPLISPPCSPSPE